MPGNGTRDGAGQNASAPSGSGPGSLLGGYGIEPPSPLFLSFHRRGRTRPRSNT